MRTFESFKNEHAGKKVLVCGCGVSLREFPYHDRFITIGVHGVGRLFDPDYLVVANPRCDFSEERFAYISQSRARYIFTYLPDLLPHRQDIVRFQPGKLNGTDFSDPSILHYTNTSVYMALCLAVHMGGSPIGIIGFDLTPNHFFAPTGEHKLSSILKLIDRQCSRLNRALQAQGIPVFNLSNQSRVSAFAKASPLEFLEYGD